MSFSNSFTSGTPVRVFVSVNHGNESSEIHNTTLVWVEDVTTSRFRACVVRGDQGSNGNITVDWLAFQGSQSGVDYGETRFTLFTTGTKCKTVTFYQVTSMFVLGSKAVNKKEFGITSLTIMLIISIVVLGVISGAIKILVKNMFSALCEKCSAWTAFRRNNGNGENAVLCFSGDVMSKTNKTM